MHERHDTFEEALEETRDRYAEYKGQDLCNVIEVHLNHTEGGLKLHIRVVLEEIAKRLAAAEHAARGLTEGGSDVSDHPS